MENKIYPRQHDKQIVYLKNVISKPIVLCYNIIGEKNGRKN